MPFVTARWVAAIALFSVFAQPLPALAHDEAKAADESAPPYTITPVMRQAMSDTGLAGYVLMAVTLDLIPGGVDTTPHRHDADLFIYVIQGEVQVALEGKGPSTFKAGQMFHEPRNIPHTLLKNASATAPAKTLAVFILKEGREFYVPITK